MRTFTLLTALICLVILLSCSGSQPVIPSTDLPVVNGQEGFLNPGHTLLGLYRIDIDPVTLESSITPVRDLSFHLNIRQFLENGPCTNCIKLVPPIVLQSYGIDVTIGLDHPFAGLKKFIGFDVRGIIMLEGDFSFPSMAVTSTRTATGGWGLRNPDGWTTVFNASYTLPGILGYSHGKMIPPTSPPPPNTLNAFKAYYSAGQSENDGGRRAMLDGDHVERTYQIQMVEMQPFHFWYAFDASWEKPPMDEPSGPEDFAPTANCPEAYRFDFSVVSGELNPDHGNVTIGMDAWDHQGWTAPYSLTYYAPECSSLPVPVSDPPLSVDGDRAHWEIDVTNDLGGLNLNTGAELIVRIENPDDDPYTGPIHGYGRFVIPVSEAQAVCNSVIHTNQLGTADYGPVNLPAKDACFIHDTGHATDGYFMGYIDGYTSTVCLTYDVDTLTPSSGPALGTGWEIPFPSEWPKPNHMDISEELGRIFIVWSNHPDDVEEWTAADGRMSVTDASVGGDVRGLDTDGSGGWWNAFFPQMGFAQGVKHFVPSATIGFNEATADSFALPETWGTVADVICIPGQTLLILTGVQNGKIRAYDISSSPPVYAGEITNIFSGSLDFGSISTDKPCDFDTDWSDPSLAHCRIIVYGNLQAGHGELVKIDTDLNILAGPVSLSTGLFNSMAINPEERHITLWPKRIAGGGVYALVELPPGW